ncbi:TonB-dependent receptor [Sphingorhabdus sp.]|uniref:TonB-dependent receptor n=1 Tax=Sphingorhabdus sp. TaxID=1902408 RepID=UPI00391DC53A
MKSGNHLLKAAMLSTISIASLSLGSAAFAQDNTPQARDEVDDNVIIVTATKREQTLQDVPISVSVTTAETIERSQVRDLIDLQTLVPSLKVGQLQSSANTNFIIRGFGNGANNAGIEPSVGVFIDGVYRSRSAAQIGDLANIQRVEVLRGPQSTLFGKNASAGIISIVTKEPQFEFGGGAEISYGNYDAVVVRGNVTGPIAETLAVAVEGNYNKRDGYINVVNLNTDSNNRNRWGVRGQILWEPSEAVKVRLIGDYDKIDEVCCGVANVFNGPTGAAVGALGGNIDRNKPFSYNTYQNFESVNDIKNYGFSGQVDWDLTDQLSLTSISAYRAVRSFTNQDSDFTSADLIGSNFADTTIDTYTQEMRIASDFDGMFNFLLGGFYFKEDIDISSGLTFGRDFRNYANLLSGGAYGGNEALIRLLNGLPAATPTTQFGAQGQGRTENFDYKNTAYSVFGQVDFELTDRLTLTGGFNYTKDKKTVASNNASTDVFSSIDLVRTGVNAGIPAVVAANPAFNPFLGLRPLQFLPPFLNYPNAVESGKTSDSDWSYTIRASYKFDERISGYVTYATGFKATSFNLSTDSRPFPTDFIPGSSAQSPAPATSPIRSAGLAVNNLTSGTRYAGPEDAVVYELGLKGQFDGFGFNLALFKQVLKGFQSNVFSGTGFVLGNAEKQSTKGMEIDATISPANGLNFTASYTYLDPKFNTFTGGSAFNAGNNIVPTNLTGFTPTGISKHSVSVGGTYNIAVGDGNALILHADYQLNSAYQIAQGLPYKAAIESLNASIAFAFDNGLELSVWGRNLTEPKYNPVIFASVAQSGSLSGYPPPPRFYGASAKFKF